MILPIRFSKSGPDGWSNLADLPLEHAGIWRSTAYTERYDHYPTDEFMVILKGEVTLENDEVSETFREGDAFFVPKGFKGVWRQPVDMVKLYVIVE